MKKLITLFYFSIILLQKLVSFEGIYEGTYEINNEYEYETGYYVGYIDSDKNINFYYVDIYDYAGKKVSGKLNNQNQISFRTHGGLTIKLTLNNDNTLSAAIAGNYQYDNYIRLSPHISAHNPSPVNLGNLIPLFSSGSGTLDLSEQNAITEQEGLTDQDVFRLFSGIYRIQKYNVELYPYRGSISGDVIITPSAVYLVGRASITGQSGVFANRVPITQDVSAVNILEAVINLDTHTLSASGTLEI